MQELLQKMLSGPLKRFLVFAIGAAVVVLNKKFSLDISEVEIASLATMVSAFLIQSGMKAVAAIKAESKAQAKGEILTADDAVEAFKKAGQ